MSRAWKRALARPRRRIRRKPYDHFQVPKNFSTRARTRWIVRFRLASQCLVSRCDARSDRAQTPTAATRGVPPGPAQPPQSDDPDRHCRHTPRQGRAAGRSCHDCRHGRCPASPRAVPPASFRRPRPRAPCTDAPPSVDNAPPSRLQYRPHGPRPPLASTSVPVFTCTARRRSWAAIRSNMVRSRPCRCSSRRNRRKAGCSGVASVRANPQNRRNDARSSSASAHTSPSDVLLRSVAIDAYRRSLNCSIQW